jgi:hypothetical protein
VGNCDDANTGRVRVTVIVIGGCWPAFGSSEKTSTVTMFVLRLMGLFINMTGVMLVAISGGGNGNNSVTSNS